MAIKLLYFLRGYLVSLSLPGMIIAALWVVGLVYLAYRSRHQHPQWSKKHLGGFFVLLAFTLSFGALFLPWMQREIPLPVASGAMTRALLVLVPLSAVGWVLAAGFLGTVPAMILAAISGILLGEWSTRMPTEPLVYATLAWIVSWALWQPYRTRAYRALRQPVVNTAIAAVTYLVLFIFSVFLIDGAHIASRLDFLFSHALTFTLYAGSALLLAGIIAQIVTLTQPQPWGYSGPYKPSPLERSLLYRFSFGMSLLMLTTMMSILVINWQLARRSARDLIIKQLTTTAHISAQTIPFFIEKEKQAIQEIATNISADVEQGENLDLILRQHLRKEAVFSALILIEKPEGENTARVLAAYAGEPEAIQHLPTQQDLKRIEFLATTQATTTWDTVPNDSRAKSSQVAFYAKVPTSSGPPRYLIGYTNFAESPYNDAIIAGFADLDRIQGEGLILNQTRGILYSTRADLGWVPQDGIAHLKPIAAQTSKPGQLHEGAYETTSPSGQRYLLVAKKAPGVGVMVLVLAPTQQLQAIALSNALPLAAIVSLLALAGLLISRSLARILTRSLRSLTVAAERIASGQLNQPLEVTGVDEIGQLRRAFEHMRQRLQARMSELSRLLHTSQRIAATLKVQEAADAVLTAAYTPECAAVRIALSAEALPDDGHDNYPTRFGRGLSAKAYEALDAPLLSLARGRALTRINNLNENSPVTLPKTSVTPRALLAVALRYETRFLGVLYIVYNTPHTFSDEETRYLSALGLQMAMAAYTARLYYMAEVRHQRLLAVLNASPDPILVTDNQERLILANLAARSQLGVSQELNRPLAEAITEESLLALLRRDQPPPYSDEITINDRVYFATVTSVKSNQAEIGRVCILRDVTHFKELDALKSDFVATVSHDLRVPLTLINGYLTMLEMVGQLNERQSHYIAQIRQGIQDMTQLVNNLLDLGRIEAGVGLQLQLTPVLDIIDNVINRWQPHAARKRILLSSDIDPETPPLIEADPVLLDRALHNLVDNAIKYTPHGGSVVILGRPSGPDKILLGVKDSGVGISPIDQPRLFEKFFRIVRRDAPKEKGSGLGLAIVKSIVERHHGRVWVESRLGEGSTFYIELPVRQPDERADTLPIYK